MKITPKRPPAPKARPQMKITPKVEPEPATVLQVEHNGFTAWCDGVRTVGHGGAIVFLSIYGVQSAVRSIWSHLVGGKSYAGLEIGGLRACAPNDVSYSAIRSLLGPQYLHLVMVHPEATSVVSPFAKGFYVLGEAPASKFWGRFSRQCQTPMRQSWRELVWALGLAAGLIQPLSGFGLPAAYVSTDEKWNEVIAAAIKGGGLK